MWDFASISLFPFWRDSGARFFFIPPPLAALKDAGSHFDLRQPPLHLIFERSRKKGPADSSTGPVFAFHVMKFVKLRRAQPPAARTPGANPSSKPAQSELKS